MYQTFQRALQDLTVRGLNQAAKWIGEQLVSLENSTTPSENDQEFHNPYAEITDTKELSRVMYACTLLSAGEYQRCAYMLRNKSFHSPSNISVFLGSYSLYLAGEKIKEQVENEVKGTSPRNPFLGDILSDLMPKYRAGTLDGHLLYLLGVVIRELQRQGQRSTSSHGDGALYGMSAGALFMESLASYPWNW
jgi:hypothetical protein